MDTAQVVSWPAQSLLRSINARLLLADICDTVKIDLMQT